MNEDRERSDRSADRRMRWQTLAGGTIGLGCSLLALYSALEFLRATDAVALIRWGAAMFFGMGAVVAVKIWYWIDSQRRALGREIERLERQLHDLAARVEASSRPQPPPSQPTSPNVSQGQ